MSTPRSKVVAVAMRKGSYAEWFKTDLSGETPGRGRVTMRTKMYLYSMRQAELLSAVLGVPLQSRR